MDAPVLSSTADPEAESFRRNTKAHQALVDELGAKLAQARSGGSDAARARHVARGKLLPRDRVDMLLDPGSPLLELSALASDGGGITACVMSGRRESQLRWFNVAVLCAAQYLAVVGQLLDKCG